MEPKPILVIDDDETIREMYKAALTEAGLEVLTAKDGQEGVTIALEEHPSVILADILMPVMNGYQAIEKIRLDSWGKTVPVIYLTNLSEPENVAKAFDQSPEKYIIKAHTDVKEVVNQVRIAMHKR